METEAQIFCLISFVFIKSKPFSWAVCPHKVLCFNTASILPNKAERRFIPWCQRHRTGALPTLAAGALAAVNDRQNDGLDVSAGAPQAEEAHGVLRIQPVAAAVTERLQIRLLRERETDMLSEARADRKRAKPTDNNPNCLHATFAKMPMACSLWWSGMVGSFRAARAVFALSLSPLGDAEGEGRCDDKRGKREVRVCR